ncbi:YheC/YheD family protein [Gorillibacterium massiliense]|uniref:YheC/YheD family endospore coat-associated protein n=1 Tax=Gorillibacterium massiliense TaxID=1280390 RepID=UPI000592E626|nr:YheC/YheD family protein [Gorillibacterium massiliense]
MVFSSCTVLVTPQQSQTISLTRSLARKLELSGVRSCSLRVGSRSFTCSVSTLNRQGDYLSIPSSVASSILLPGSGKCLVKSDHNREIQIGPLIGILTTTSAKGTGTLFGSRSPLFRDMIQAGKGNSFYFIFTPQGVNWRDETVSAYFPSANGGWIRRTVPLPDVIYNRLPNRASEKSLYIREFKERFTRRKIPLLNWEFFEKWDVYRLLQNDSDAYSHVPDSSLNPSSQEIKSMLDKHRFVYLKPTGGSLGFGIYRLTHNPSKGYFARYREGKSNLLFRFPRFEGLMNMIRRKKIRLSSYVVQQGIQLIEIDDCPIDFRFHMTKNGNNDWVAAGIGAKKAGKGSVTTHVRTGGQLLTPDRAMREVFGDRSTYLLQEMEDVAIRLAKSIELHSTRNLAELGIDLGIDQDEKIWMFEANSKPGRTIFKHPDLKHQGKDISGNLFEHFLYVTRFR